MENKVTVVYYDVNQEIAEEKLWVEKKSDLEYQIKNIPFFAPNLAYDDIISVENDEGELYFEDLIQASEHSTIQIVFFNEEKIKNVTKAIEEMGCSWEGIDEQKIIAVDIPSSIDYAGIKSFFEKMLAENTLDYKEACLSETHLSTL
ncbi:MULTISPECIES: DUF4265 domain-containing protein [Chryseobacterium]|uniref:Uncharacterized protein DUF4265 n=2 Tax=Chryseobacterium TaxID=59732 RepID=A0A543EN47_9FLAO|nr:MULTISPECIES: DUF4265 domain-containing protein [Chryseobacterium]MDR6457737.1 hypothetical protein [Chryseobacterium vietnamense]TQM22997.1 uncharacterized protein DUF4265 [Chryseobacterium aquifrigidense]